MTKDALEEVVHSLKAQIEELKAEKVSVHTFEPIQKIVYGLVGTALLAVLAAVLELVIRH